MITIAVSRTTKGIDPFLLGDAQLFGIVGRCEDTSSSEVDHVERVHEKGVYQH